MEGSTFWSGRCCKGDQDVLDQRLAEGHWRELPVVLYPPVSALTVPCVAVLQGGCDMEIPSASECSAVGRSDDAR